MFKRILLAMTFVAAFAAAGLVPADSANAWRGWYGRPYGAFYGRPVVYRSYAPYRAYYAAPYYAPYYAPRVYAAYPYDYGYGYPYAYPGSYYYGPRAGVAVSFGY
jgi:hypothetical protein